MNLFRTFEWTGDQPVQKAGALFRCAADIFSIITNCEILQPVMLVVRRIIQVSPVRCRYDWHNRRSSRKVILFIQPPIARAHLTVYSLTAGVSDEHWFNIKNRLNWEICETKLHPSDNIPVA
jgi:hypothetical protein